MLTNELLDKLNMKKTFARKVILECVHQQEQAVDADFIYEYCVSKGYNVNLSTVYRTLELFEEKGLIEKFDSGDRKYNYAFKKDSHKHTIECSLCHKEVELDCPVKMLEEVIKSKTGFTMMQHELHIKGICEKCSGNNKK